MSETIWSPLRMFDDGETGQVGSRKTALIMLNQPITKDNESKFIYLWKNADLRICVDGAMNRLHQWCIEKCKSSDNNNQDLAFYDKYVPDFVCGDLDSIDERVKELYVSKGSKCVRLVDQDATDFTKSLKFVIEFVSVAKENRNLSTSTTSIELFKDNPAELMDSIKHVNIDQIYIFCDFSGRLDHAISNLSSLYTPCLDRARAYIVSEESITFLLRSGRNLIKIDNEFRLGKYCGFFPLGAPSRVTTRGFKWNVSGEEMRFGKFVSSSNEFDCSTVGAKQVEIDTEHPLLFTMSVA